MITVAIVGMPGAGKTELANLFVSRGFKKIRFGDLTEKYLKEKGLPVTPENEKQAREELRHKYGMHAYALLNLPQILEMLKTSNVVIDGLYSWEEYLYLKNQLKERFFVIAVYASPKIRATRLSCRKERPMSPQEMLERDKAEIENLNKAGPIAVADYTIINHGTIEQLQEEFEKILKVIYAETTMG